MQDNQQKETSTNEVQSTRDYKKNRVGSEILCTRPDRSWGQPSLLYNGHRISFPGVKRSGRGLNHQPPSSGEVEERLELHIYSPSGPSWPVLGQTLSLLFVCQSIQDVSKRSNKRGKISFRPSSDP